MIKNVFFLIMKPPLLIISIIFLNGCKKIINLKTEEVNFNLGIILGKSNNPILNEISGIVASRQNSGMFWVHNDSGDESRIFLIDSLAQLKAIFFLKNITNRDWEDIAITQINGENWIYVADIGDNQAVYDTKYIYRFKEPKLGEDKLIENVETVSFQYSDGNRDAETLLIDQVSKTIYIVSKREEKKRLYSLNFVPNSRQTAQFLGDVNFSISTTANVQVNQALYIVGGDISSNNQEIIIKNYAQAFHWSRKANESLLETLTRTPQNVPYIIEPQGEAITFGTNNNGYYTLSEGNSGNEISLYFYGKK